MFHSIWKTIRNIAVAFGVLLSLIFALELLRAVIFLYRIHPAAGITAITAIVVAALFFIPHAFSWLRHPRALVPPPLPSLETASHKELRAYCRYLSAYLGRLAENPHVDPNDREAACAQMDYIRDVLRHHPLNDDLRLAIQKTRDETIVPILNRLGDVAERHVRDGVRDVMIGVMVSPYPSMDLLIVLYRNFMMVNRIMNVYRTRPSAREQWHILCDIAAVVATVNFINLNRKLIETLGSQIPVVGRFIDTLAQGLGAGIFTSVAGHAAIARCSAFAAWDRGHAAEQLGAQSVQFLRDVRLILTRDLMPELKPRFRAEVPAENAEQPGFWDVVETGIRDAVDTTARCFDAFLIRPAVAGVQGVGSVARGVVHGGHCAVRASAKGSSRIWRKAVRGLSTFAERIQYTIIGRRIHRL